MKIKRWNIASALFYNSCINKKKFSFYKATMVFFALFTAVGVMGYLSPQIPQSTPSKMQYQFEPRISVPLLMNWSGNFVKVLRSQQFAWGIKDTRVSAPSVLKLPVKIDERKLIKHHLHLNANNRKKPEVIYNSVPLRLETSATDYFRSKVTGNWNSVSSWESSADNNVWIASSLVPNAAANTVSIQGGHTISITSSVSIDQLVIGGSLNITTFGFAVNDGPGDDVIIESGGLLKYSSGSNYAVFSGIASTISTESGGRIWVGIGDLSNTQVDNYIYKNASILEWGLSAPFSSGVTYFPNANTTVIPIFRFSNNVGNVGGGNQLLINGLLEANGPITFVGSGTKIFRNGIRGTGVVTQKNDGGKLILGNSSSVPEIGGSLTLNVLTAGLQLPNGANVPVGTEIKIMSSEENNSINRQGGELTVNGILDLTNMRITNTASGSVIVNGSLKTANTGGLYGTGAAIASGILTLNVGSTIEYNGTADQAVSSEPQYFNIAFSGAGVKTTQGRIAVDKNGLVNITGITTVNATSNLASTGSNNTAFKMDGGRLIIGTGGTQPNMQGLYDLAGGVVEFAGNSVTNIRTGAPAKHYFNVDISGNKVETGGKNFMVNNILKVSPTGVLNVQGVDDTVNPYVVTAKKGLRVAIGGSLIFGNNAQLLQGEDAVNNGNITLLRKSKMKRLDYIYWGAPVSGQPFLAFSPNTIPTRFYNYNEMDDSFSSIQNPATSYFIPGKGYAIRAPNTASSATYDLFEGQFTGVPNNGNGYRFDLKFSDARQGLNMISNPYPSNINLRLLTSNNPSLTDGLYYFWTNNANSGTGNPTNTPNGSYGTYALNQYAMLNALGSLPASSGADGSGVFPSAIIRPGQGFLIKAKAAGSLTFDHSIRTSAITDGNNTSIFFNNRTPPEEPVIPMDRIWLKLVTPAQNKNILLIGYVDDSRNAFDPKYDAETMSASDQFYSIVEGKYLAIQGRSLPVSDEDIVTLGASFYEPGTYSIGIEAKEGFFKTGKAIYIYDKKLNIYTNLQLRNYTFDAEIGVDNDRFELRYKESHLSAIDRAKGEVKIYREGANYIVKTEVKIIELEVYDSSGRKILRLEPHKKEVMIEGILLIRGVFTVKIKTEQEMSIKKIVN